MSTSNSLQPEKKTETSINAMDADIQSMNDGEAKTTATKEMKVAEEMMAGPEGDDDDDL